MFGPANVSPRRLYAEITVLFVTLLTLSFAVLQ